MNIHDILFVLYSKDKDLGYMCVICIWHFSQHKQISKEQSFGAYKKNVTSQDTMS